MPTSPNYGLPYPALTDSPNVPEDVAALAVAVDTEIARVDAAAADALTNEDYFAGSVTVNAVGGTPTSAALAFGKTFSVTPICAVTGVSVAPGTLTEVTVSNQTTTGCTVWVHRTVSASVIVNVIAFVPS
jgi:hypothetical protein